MPIAIVTGASAGIGLETARGLAKKNYDLVLVSRNLKKLNSIKRDLESQYSISCDVFSYDLSLIKSFATFILKLYFFVIFTKNNFKLLKFLFIAKSIEIEIPLL